MKKPWIIVMSILFLLILVFLLQKKKLEGSKPNSDEFGVNPFDRQVAEKLKKLQSFSFYERAGAAEALGIMRAYSAADNLVQALDDTSVLVRREAVMALAWCGGRKHIDTLIGSLHDHDWIVRQGAWVTLTNLTGMEWPFDALAELSIRRNQAEVWENWWLRVPNEVPPSEVIQLAIDKDNNENRLRGIRALGVLGGKGSNEAIVNVLGPFRNREYTTLNPLEKHLIQSCIRSLGRLREPEAFPILLDFLNSDGWARYAADALGDFGAREAVKPLIAAYPKFARKLESKILKAPQIIPRDDILVGDNMQDRMYETPYAIAAALVRLPLDDPNDIIALRQIGPWLVANLPSDWDGAMIYDVEADQLITAYLLEMAGLRQATCNAAFNSADHPERWIQQDADAFVVEGRIEEELLDELSIRLLGDVPYMSAWFPVFCRENDVPRLIPLLNHENGWVRINTAKALMFIGSKRAIKPIARLLVNSHPEAEYGYSGVLEHAEYDDPAPRWREAYIRALGRLGAKKHTDLLIKILEDNRNVLEMHTAVVFALDELGTSASLDALMRAEVSHPFHSVRLIAREILWRRGISPPSKEVKSFYTSNKSNQQNSNISVSKKTFPEAVVFIKGNNTVRSDFNGQAGVDPWRQTYVITNSGPAMRVGRNLFIFSPVGSEGKVIPLTNFKDGFVADCEVSWDGKKVIFSRRLNGEERNYYEVPYQKSRQKEVASQIDGPNDPWWHIWEINVDGTGLHQLTSGPYHDVAPVYLPDDRIVFSSSRIGMRDEYHGYPCVGLTVMNSDGSDIHPIGFNLGADRDPAIMHDGRILFSRLDIFYSRLKTEVTIQTVFPDGTKNLAFYGPERRPFWRKTHVKNAAWTMRESWEDNPDSRNRVLRLAQPQPLDEKRVICASSGGLVVCGPGPYKETLVPHDRKMAVTSPIPIEKNTVLCAATPKVFNVDGKIVTCGTPEFEKLEKGPELFRSAINIDLALYLMDIKTGDMTLLYNDPETADFEPRPISARSKPLTLAENPMTRQNSFTAKLFCNSARISRIPRVQSRGKFIRVIEGQPIFSRHQTHQNRPINDKLQLDQRWKNHGGTKARILGTIPLAADGSFFVEIPADRLFHFQVLDSDRRVIGNQVFWMYARPGETRSCIGCHEHRETTLLPNRFASAAQVPPVRMLPHGDEFSYLAKAWMKGWLPDEMEERTRTVHAINLIGRY